MIYVDREIIRHNEELIVEGFDVENVNPVSYDITVDARRFPDGFIYIKPKDFFMVKSQEKIHVPDDMIVRVVEKNSIIRMGLAVSGPVYQPGHCTYCWIRVQNVSNVTMRIWTGFHIAQLMFEGLHRIPDTLYSNIPNASFNNETSYRGFGNYNEVYNKMLSYKIQEQLDWEEKFRETVY